MVRCLGVRSYAGESMIHESCPEAWSRFSACRSRKTCAGVCHGGVAHRRIPAVPLASNAASI